jgi:hypothetical protein
MAANVYGVMSMSGPSQPKVEGEEWSDERIQSFLDLIPRDDINPDFFVLKEAYQYMTPEFFARFVPYFVEAGRDISARNPDGVTLLERMSEFAKSAPYIEVLRKNGAQ